MMDLVQITPSGRARLPEWLRKPETHFSSATELKKQLRSLDLHTVCESARCPNIHECFHRGAATFMILGNLCTRGCGFCSVPKAKYPGPLDASEPANVARMAAAMQLKYVVITSVNRDDLADGGAAHWAETVREVRKALPAARIEVLTPDFCGNLDALATVLESAPDVYNHNMETVPRLYKKVRPQADYEQSLRVLKQAKRIRPAALTKSGLMVGLGETEEEVTQLLADLAENDVDVATIGQYLQPARRNLAVAEFVKPEQFERYRELGLAAGLKNVFSGSFVRSSYMADLVSEQASHTA